MRTVVVAAVYYGTEARRHLYHRGVKALSEGSYRQVCPSHILVKGQGTGSCFSRQVYVGLLSEIKYPVISEPLLLAHGEGDVHKHYVAGLRHALLDGKRPVSKPVVAVYLEISDLQIAPAVIGLVAGYTAAVYGACNGKGLHYRAGLKGIGDAEISPDPVADICPLLAAHVVDLTVRSHRGIFGLGLRFRRGIFRRLISGSSCALRRRFPSAHGLV